MAGVREKLAKLRELVNEDRTNPWIRALVSHIWRERNLWDPKQVDERAAAILEWAQDHLMYIHEPIETFTRPRRVLLDKRFAFGDCDELNTAIATLYESAGYRTVLEALGWEGSFRHLGGRVALPPGAHKSARRWVAFEGTLRVPLGYDPVARARARFAPP